MRVLLSSVGRRGYLVKYFKQAMGDAGEVWVQTAVPMPLRFGIATMLCVAQGRGSGLRR